MKLKYYMRGIGIGIILTTLILIIGNPKEKLTEQEVISRAKGLGMVMGESNNPDLEEMLEDINPTNGAEEISTTLGPEPSAGPSVTPTPEPSVAPTSEPSVAPTSVPTIEPAPTVKPTDIPVITVKPVSDNEADSNAGITFTIKGGMSSRIVSVLLEQVGLIDNADKFNQYIEDAGKASIIKTGTYIITKGASFDEIIRIITTKK